METQKDKVHSALEQFARGSTLEIRGAAASELLAARSVSKVASTSEFLAGIDWLINAFAKSEAEFVRLGSLSQLVRLLQAHPPLRKEIRSKIVPLLTRQLPPITLLETASDREYVARALAWTKDRWVPTYAANAIAQESTGERARREFAGLLVSNSNSITEVLLQLSDAFDALSIDTENPADTFLRRVARALFAVRTAMSTARLEIGADPGDVFTRLIGRQLDRYGTSTSDETQQAFLKEVLLFTHQMVRTRFSLAVDPTVYAAIRTAKLRMAKSDWPRGTADARDLIAEVVQEGILLQAKQAIVSPDLRRLLELAIGEKYSDGVLRRLSDDHSELVEPVRAWLRRQKFVDSAGTPDAIKRQDALDTDELVGECLLAQNRLLFELRRSESNISGATSDNANDTAALVGETLLRLTTQLSDQVEKLARARQLSLLGTFDEQVSFNKKYFDSVKQPALHTMRVHQPAVVRMNNDGSPGEVVIKGIAT